MPDVDGALADVTSQLVVARMQAALDLAQGKKWIAAVRPIWDLLERRTALRTQKTYPQYSVYYDVKVVGIEAPDGTFTALRGGGRLELPTRTWDELIVQWDGADPDRVAYAKPVELKSGGAKTAANATTRLSGGPLASSVAGGLSDERIVAEFRPRSAVGKQLHKDRSLRQRRGRLVVEAVDPVTHEVRTIRIDTNALDRTSVRTYESELDSVRGTTTASRGTDGMSHRGVGGAGRQAATPGQPDRDLGQRPHEPGSPARIQARRRGAGVHLERLRARVRSGAVRRGVQAARATGGAGGRATLGGIGRGVVRGGFALGKALLWDIAVGFVLGAVIAESDRRDAEAAADQAYRKIEDALVKLYFARERWMRDTLRRNPGMRFYYVVTMHYDMVPGQDGGSDRWYGPYVSGDTYRTYGGRGDTVRVPDYRIDTEPAAPSGREPYQTVISVDVNYVDLSTVPLSGTWQTATESVFGPVTEIDRLGLQVTIAHRQGRTAVSARSLVGGGPVRVSDVQYMPDAHTLEFAYHAPHPMASVELSHNVALVLTEPDLFEGEDTQAWTGGTTNPLILRRITTPDGRRLWGTQRPGAVRVR